MRPPKLTGSYVMGRNREPRSRGSKAATQALGRLPPGTMNKTEKSYSILLEARLQAGEIAWYSFEPMKLRLAKATFYEPDFLVMLADGTLEFHEVKGFWEDDARVKIKVAAEKFGIFVFVGVTVDRASPTGWKEEKFGW